MPLRMMGAPPRLAARTGAAVMPVTNRRVGQPSANKGTVASRVAVAKQPDAPHAGGRFRKCSGTAQVNSRIRRRAMRMLVHGL